MEILLLRKYFPGGTNGSLFINGKLQCFTIELPWVQNHNGTSCIPEGFYNLQMRYTERLGHHLEILNVPGRSMILIHAANNAIKELKGCMAPVSEITGQGCGNSSKQALDRLIETIRAVGNKTVFLNIQKDRS